MTLLQYSKKIEEACKMINKIAESKGVYSPSFGLRKTKKDEYMQIINDVSNNFDLNSDILSQILVTP